MDHLMAQTELQPDSEQGTVLRSLCALQLGACLAASGTEVERERDRVLNRLRKESICDIITWILR